MPITDGGTTRDLLATWAARPDRGVIFDFNGTLSDDEPILFEVFREIFAERLGHHLAPAEYEQRLRGLSDREIVEAVVSPSAAERAALVEELLVLRAERYVAKVVEESPVRPGTVALVRRLGEAGVPMGIVTGAQRREVELVLHGSPVGEHLSALVCEEDVSRGKPDPEGFRLGASRLGLDPGRVLAFEDSVPGVTAALAAGMSCLAVSPGGPSPELAAVAPGVVASLDPTLLDSLPGLAG